MLLTIVASTACQAGSLLPSYAHLSLLTDVNPLVIQNSEGLGDMAKSLYDETPSASFGDGSAGTYRRARSTGFTSLNAVDFLGVESFAETDALLGGASSSSIAQWRDIAFLPGGSSLSSIRLNFEVAGSLEINSSSSVARISVNRNSDVSSWAVFDDEGSGPINASLWGPAFDPEDGFQHEGWDSLRVSFSGNRVDFVASTHVNAVYNSDYDGYTWRIALSTVAGAIYNGGFDRPGIDIQAKASSLRSLGFTSATDSHGNLLNVTFASGLSASAVPEPGTAAVWSAMGLLMAVIRRRRPEKAC